MRAVVLQNVAQKVVMRADIKEFFTDLDESPFKMMIRRQYYLYTKGVQIDNVAVTFSLDELLKSGILNQRIENARKRGRLDLSNLKISSLHGLQEVADKVGRVILELNLNKNEIEKIWVKHFEFYFSHLQRLDLSYNRINFLQDGCFDVLVNLHFLDLGHNKIFYLPDYLFSNLEKLEGLDLLDNKLEKLNKRAFSGIKPKKVNLVDN